MLIEYKASELRPELIRLKDNLEPGLRFFGSHALAVNEAIEREPKSLLRSLFGKQKVEKLDTLTYTLMSGAMVQRLETMIRVCDMAVDAGRSVWVDSDDFLFIEQLKSLSRLVNESKRKVEQYERA